MSGKIRWRDHERGPYIRTISGRQFFLREPSADQMYPTDIAHHLSGIYRYTGASRYSVAQHCVLAARMAHRFYKDHPDLPAQMLVHDVAEAYYGDMSSPLKSLNPAYKDLEKLADAAVEQRFGVRFVGVSLVKEIDDRMWLTESRQLFGESAMQDYDGPLEPFPLTIPIWSPFEAETYWLDALGTRLPGVKW